jgi:hypothetical protein
LALKGVTKAGLRLLTGDAAETNDLAGLLGHLCTHAAPGLCLQISNSGLGNNSGTLAPLLYSIPQDHRRKVTKFSLQVSTTVGCCGRHLQPGVSVETCPLTLCYHSNLSFCCHSTLSCCRALTRPHLLSITWHSYSQTFRACTSVVSPSQMSSFPAWSSAPS